MVRRNREQGICVSKYIWIFLAATLRFYFGNSLAFWTQSDLLGPLLNSFLRLHVALAAILTTFVVKFHCGKVAVSQCFDREVK